MKTPWLKRAFPWALYDWANPAFATTVMAAFVPVFNKDNWSAGEADAVSTFRLSVASSTAAITVALLAPVLGAIADRGGAKKALLAFFAGFGALATAGLALAGQGQWAFALALYVVTWIEFAGANVFYDSLLMSVAEPDKFDVAVLPTLCAFPDPMKTGLAFFTRSETHWFQDFPQHRRFPARRFSSPRHPADSPAASA